jgi:hypothetical protein
MRGLIVGLPLSCLLWLVIIASARSLWAAPDAGKTEVADRHNRP